MFFSVIIPTYNRRYFLKISLESVLEQTFKDFELIIVDDGSTDKTYKLIKGYKDKRIKYLKQENKGPASARNLGIKESKGKFICFLDSDDRYRNDKLEITNKYIKRNPGYKIFHTQELWYKNSRYLSQKIEHKKPNGFIFKKALKICCVSLSTACINKDLFLRVGVFDENFPVCEDYEFWLRASLFYPVKLIPHYLTIKEGGRIDQQSRKKGLDKYRFFAIYKIIKNYRLPLYYLKEALRNLEEKAEIYTKGASKRKKVKEISQIKDKLKEIKDVYTNSRLS